MKSFKAVFPRAPQIGDEVIIKGKLKDDARVISINFCLSSPDQTIIIPFIAFHFKTIFSDDGSSIVILNYKNVTWNEEVKQDNIWIKSPGDAFSLIFRFGVDDIKVFVDDTEHTHDYSFPNEFPSCAISEIEIWDDLEYVSELSFKFSQNSQD